MSYAPRRDQVQEVTINKLCHNQLMIEKHHYKYGTMLTSSPGSSATFLSNFITQYRTNILAFTCNTVKVTSYVMKEINGCKVVIPDPTKPSRRRFVTTYDPAKKERIYGTGDVNDSGTIAKGGELPLHEAVGVFKRPEVLRVGYHEGNYTRFAPWGSTDHSAAAAEEWTQALIDSINPLCEAMRAAVIQDVIAPELGWRFATWSPGYWADVWSDTNPQNSWGAAEVVGNWFCTRYVRTQVSRRYSTAGMIEGK